MDHLPGRHLPISKLTPSLLLRPATERDEDFLVALQVSLFPPGLPPLPPSLLRLQYSSESRAYQERFGDDGHEIIYRNGIAVGRWWVYRTAEEIRLVDIRLLPSERGLGVGSALIGRLQAEALSRPIFLRVAAGNTAALRLYRRHGFTVIGQSGLHLDLRWSLSGDSPNRK